MDSFPETHNNPQRLRSAGDFQASDRRSKRTCANTVCALLYFHVIEGQNAITRSQEILKKVQTCVLRLLSVHSIHS